MIALPRPLLTVLPLMGMIAPIRCDTLPEGASLQERKHQATEPAGAAQS